MSPKSLPPKDLFSSYEEAIADLYPRIENHFLLTNVLQFSPPALGIGLSQSKIDKYHATDVKNWFARTADLPRPWPEEFYKKLFMPLNYLPRESHSLAAHKINPQIRPKASPLGWLFLEDMPSRRRLVRMLVEEIGVPPHLYLEQLGTTLLGASAYTLNTPALEILLRHTSPPESRLIIHAHHFPSVHAPWLLESTLLHRVIERYKRLSATNNKTEFDQAIETVGLLIKHDPQAVLIKNSLSQLPDHLGAGTDLGEWLAQHRRTLVSRQTRAQLRKIARCKRSSSGRTSKPRI